MMKGYENPNTRMYIHRRIVVRFLEVLLVLLSVASFVSIALGLGTTPSFSGQEDSGTPTRLTDMRPFYALVVGSDSLEGTALYTGDVNARQQANPQADAVMLVRVDPGDCTMTFVTVPSNTILDEDGPMLRDTLVEGNPRETVRTVERIAGVSIRYYFVMGFSAFEALVNQVGDVTADVPVSITMQDPVTARTVTVPSGTNMKLDAPQTLAYVRSWDPYVADADPHRQLNVRNTAVDLLVQVLGSEDEAVRKVLGLFEDQVQTNISNNTLISLVTRFYDEREITQVFACTGPYLSTSINADGEPVIERQLTAWRALMTVVDSGEDPATIMPQYNFQGDKSDYVKEKTPASSGKGTSSTSSKASAKSKAESKSASSSKGA
ncbi:MAG: LCP family protein [Coriobacteriia bacterium]|nr:LCP family protein [Coriobacteriia bacterium]